MNTFDSLRSLSMTGILVSLILVVSNLNSMQGLVLVEVNQAIERFIRDNYQSMHELVMDIRRLQNVGIIIPTDLAKQRAQKIIQRQNEIIEMLVRESPESASAASAASSVASNARLKR